MPTLGTEPPASPASLSPAVGAAPLLQQGLGQGTSPPLTPSMKPFVAAECPKDQILHRCGRNHQETAFHYIRNVSFILRRSCGSEGNTDKKTKSSWSLVSSEHSRRELRSRAGVSGTKSRRETVGNLLQPMFKCSFKTGDLSKAKISSLESCPTTDVVQTSPCMIF